MTVTWYGDDVPPRWQRRVPYPKENLDAATRRSVARGWAIPDWSPVKRVRKLRAARYGGPVRFAWEPECDYRPRRPVAGRQWRALGKAYRWKVR